LDPISKQPNERLTTTGSNTFLMVNTMTDFRALCAELVDELEDWIAYGDEADCADAHAVVDRARAALAQPEPQGPTDEELYDYWISTSPEFGCADPVGFARAVLARWGRTATAAKPVSVAERLPGPEDCDAEGRSWFGGKRGIWMLMTSKYAMADSFWLPHHALPVPQQEANDD
jgi:hypothetical protein